MMRTGTGEAPRRGGGHMLFEASVIPVGGDTHMSEEPSRAAAPPKPRRPVDGGPARSRRARA